MKPPAILVLAVSLVSLSAVRAQLDFRDSPANTTVLANFPTSLSCTAQQPAPSSIWWEKDGSRVENNGRIAVTYDSLSGRSELGIESVAYSDAGEYVCRAASEDGVVIGSSQLAILTVQGIPSFVAPLAPITVPLGSTAELDCQVLSNPAPAISWSYELGTVTRSLSTGGRFTIAPPNVLTIINVQEEDAGYYICSAMNAFGRNTTSARLLIGDIQAPFEVTISPSEEDPIQVVGGDSMTLSCTVPVGTPISSILWSRPSNEQISTVTRVTNGLLLLLSSVSAETTDQYTCSVTDTSGTTITQSIGVQVLIPPTFTVVPSNVTGVINKPLQDVFFCVATGTPVPTITWLDPDLTPLPGTPQFSLLTRDDGGTYVCLATNSVGESQVQFTITVEGVPLVSTTPSDVTTPPGSDVVFRCIVEGFPVSTFAWSRMDGQPLTPSSLLTSTSLHLFGVSSQDAGVYLCTATNSIGTTTAQANLTVLSNPSITSITSSPVSVLASSSLTLNCTGTGPPDTVLHWYLNDTILDPEQDTSITITPDGTLTITNTTISHTGTYTCNVSTSFASVLSQIHVVVGVIPSILTPPSDVDLAAGATASLDCRVSGFPHPRTIWYMTNLVSNVSRRLDVVGPTHIQVSDGLQLHDVGVADSGIYECVVENALGTTRENTIVRVEGPPLVTSIGPNTTLTANTTARLACSVPLNFPTPAITWTTPIGPPVGRYSVDQSGVLFISPVLVEDAGGVACTATNQFGESSIMATIRVLYPPAVTTTPPSVAVLLGNIIMLNCSALGEPLPQVSWRNPSGIIITNKEGADSALLTITDATSSDAGMYTCEATNELGTSNDVTMVTIIGEVIPGLSVINTTTSTITIQWRQPSPQALARLLQYEVAIRIRGEEDMLLQGIPTFISMFTAPNFSPGVTYEVVLRGRYTGGVVGEDSTVLATTLETAPSGPPTNFTAAGIDNGIYVEFFPPDKEERNGIIVAYNIEFHQILDNITSNVRIDMPNQSTVGVNEPVRHSQHGLPGNTSFNVRVEAFTAIGAGPFTTPITVSTFQGPFDLQEAVAITIGVGVPLVVLVLVVLVVLCAYFVYWRKTRVGKHDPLLAAEKGRRRDRKEKPVKTVSGPIAGIAPQIDHSMHGKFTVHGENGRVINLNPKVITEADVAPPPLEGGEVRKVGRHETVLAPSNDKTDMGRIDPYNTPVDAIKSSGVATPQKSTSSVHVSNRPLSGIYSEVSDVMKTPPTPTRPQVTQDDPYEEVEYDNSGDIWGQEAEEESEDGSQFFDKQTRGAHGHTHYDHSPSLENPEAPDVGRDDSHLLYASVSQEHVERKRERRLKELEQPEEVTVETKQQRKMREKMEREQLKMEEKALKRERKKEEAERKKREKDKSTRESLGLSNIVSYNEIDFGKPGARAQADFIDTATASLF